MSATNRGGERSPADFYATPAWCVRRLLERIDVREQLCGPKMLEPSAGDGAIVRAVNQYLDDFAWDQPKWTLCELRQECELELEQLGKVKIGDFLRSDIVVHLRQHDAIIGNPPFRYAEEFAVVCVKRARSWKRPAPTCLLLRLDFLGSEERRELFHEIGAPDVYVLPNRPSFTGTGSDSCDYAWMVWPEQRQSVGRLAILATTPLAERRGTKLPPELDPQMELLT